MVATLAKYDMVPNYKNTEDYKKFVGDVTACSCAAVTTSHSYDVAPSFLDNYATGGDNKITIQGPNRCIGVGGLDGTHTVARIVVTY